MTRNVLFAAVAVACLAGSAMAEGLPSKSKLSQLGLSSMTVANDDAGLEVRGKGFGGLNILYNLAAFTTIVVDAGPPPVLATQQSLGGSNLVANFGSAPRTLGAIAGADLGFGIGDTTGSTTGLAIAGTIAAPNNFVSTPIFVQTIVGGVVQTEAQVSGFITARAR